LDQLRVLCRPMARVPSKPRIVPAGGDVQDPAHGGDAMGGLMRLHEFEDPGGIEPVSRANQAAAFFRISRSSRSVAFSRLRRCNSLRSSVVRPSLRRPSSRSAWRTQFEMHWAVGSNSRARSDGDRPARTSSTIRRRYSSGYGLRDFAIVDSYHHKGVRVHETGATSNPLLRTFLHVLALTSQHSVAPTMLRQLQGVR